MTIEGVPEGPGAARCEVCGRSVRDCCRIDCEAQKSEQSNAALAEHAKCWRLGYELARARLVEVERERDEARAIAEWVCEAADGEMVPDFAESFPPVREAIDARAALMESLNLTAELRQQAESSASAAEGALRAIDCCDEHVCRACDERINAAFRQRGAAALSGLPPLTSETVESEDAPLGSHAADLKELRIVQAENDRLLAEAAVRVCPGSGWPSTTTMSNSAGTGGCGICHRTVLVGPLNQCHTHALATPAALVPKEEDK